MIDTDELIAAVKLEAAARGIATGWIELFGPAQTGVECWNGTVGTLGHAESAEGQLDFLDWAMKRCMDGHAGVVRCSPEVVTEKNRTTGRVEARGFVRFHWFNAPGGLAEMEPWTMLGTDGRLRIPMQGPRGG